MNPLSRFGINVETDGIESAAIYGMVLAYSHIEKKIIDYLKAYNLSPSQYNALMIIKHKGQDKGMSQVEISDKLIISASNMTRLLDKLDKEKLIERFPAANDRRINYIKITKKGSDRLDEIWPGYYKAIKAIATLLNDDELHSISVLTLKWFENLEKAAL